jgi:hypothetical protein
VGVSRWAATRVAGAGQLEDIGRQWGAGPQLRGWSVEGAVTRVGRRGIGRCGVVGGRVDGFC